MLLLGAGASTNLADISGWTPLITACVRGFLPLVGMLYKASADMHKADARGRTPFFWVCRCDQLSVVHYLVYINEVTQVDLNDGLDVA